MHCMLTKDLLDDLDIPIKSETRLISSHLHFDPANKSRLHEDQLQKLVLYYATPLNLQRKGLLHLQRGFYPVRMRKGVK